MKQNAYLFTAGVTCAQMRPSPDMRGLKSLQTWDTCMSAIIYGRNAAGAQKTFEDWCQSSRKGEDTVQTEIKRIVGAEFIEQLLTESDPQQLDWPEFSRKWMQSSTKETDAAEETPMTDAEEGYWVDVQQAVPPESFRLDLESLQRGLPADLCSALNWSPDKKFLFLVTSLSPPSVLAEPHEEVSEADSEEGEKRDDGDSRPVLDETVALLPEMREKQAAALVEARNSVVAAWLWRKFAANTRLASNEIIVNPCCAIMSQEKNTLDQQIEVKAPIARIWRALTDYREFGQWFQVKLEGPFVAGEPARGQLSYPGYESLKFEVIVQKMEPERLFSFTWHPYAADPEQDYSKETPTVVEFRLEKTPGGTLLTVTESGFDKVPAHRRALAFRMNNEGWGAQMENIARYVANEP